MHPKMQYTYVGIDSHKDSHTAVFIDCFFEKLGELQFVNLPSAFGAFLRQAKLYRRPTPGYCSAWRTLPSMAAA